MSLLFICTVINYILCSEDKGEYIETDISAKYFET